MNQAPQHMAQASIGKADRIRLLSICGSGRSGTTILSLLLSQNDDVFNLGQSRDLCTSYMHSEICACGSTLPDCSVWSRIVETAFGDRAEEEVEAFIAEGRAFIKEASRVGNWDPATRKISTLRIRHGRYLDRLAKFLKAIQSVTGCQAFVDSSKTPEVALAYSLLPEVDVYVLNLVRDPRAVVFSWMRKLGSLRASMRYAGIWRYRQQRLEKWGKVLKSHYRELDYDAFVAQPPIEVQKLLSWIGANAEVENFTDPVRARISWDRQHIFPPINERILAERKTTVEIAAPSAWRESRNWRVHWSTVLRTYPTGLRYILRSKSNQS